MHAAAPDLRDDAPIDARVALHQLPALQFELHRSGDRKRCVVEDYIRSRFVGRHDAHVSHFLPELVTLGTPQRHCGAVGLAPAASGPLFAEVYLDAPIEQCIAAKTSEAVSRHDILEIGNLVSTWRGSSLLLFVFLSELIDRLGYRWVAFTATREVEALLARLGYAPVPLADADPGRLPDAGVAWGSYYRHRPRVVFGEVPPAVAAARRGVLYRMVARLIASQVEAISAQFRSRHRMRQDRP